MLNDRDDKYEGQEESEYHFSDEDVSYEVETETPKPVAAVEQKESIFNRLTRSKRMLISMVVFLVLIFVVYKMVTPTTIPTPSTDITPVRTVAERPSMAQQQPGAQAGAPSIQPPSLIPPTQQTAAALPPAQQPAGPPPAQASPAQQPAMVPPAVTVQPPAMQQQPMPTQVIPSQPTQPADSMMAAQQPGQQPQPASTPIPSQAMPPQQMAQQPISPQPIPPQQTMPTAPMQQAVSPTSGMAAPDAGMAQPAITPPLESQVPGGASAQMAAVASESNRLMNQFQADYAQKLNDYAAQNKAMQDQLQALNSRLAGMESQMTQLIQALTRGQGQGAGAAAPAQAQPQAAEPKIAYNVQAIIPGRAWLRSDSGETLTVAEGDLIKGVGRVTKIDPYDGVVEINTGNRVVSLSYGNGG
ncbi:hypothetical protein [Aquicella lusitana]|uniref:Uncharacterized protein n=1 Tax=Aquicella lusitana TaxID=254246 RepID=A0A370GY85_9COXI|nr:hypothetical protein [Aquicella lusitana]RDI48617.1 hypothetical protein C8D86_10245 [Aquicella lusitana]VVC74006.1 hypothetical protein AQULUS_17680 [Aquicella lusitana]